MAYGTADGGFPARRTAPGAGQGSNVHFDHHCVRIPRKQLTDAAAGRETPEACQLFSVQTVSAVLVLAAVLYYFYLTGQAVKGPFDSPCDKKLKSLNHFSNGLVLGAAMIRLYNLFFSRAIAPCEGTQEAAEEELENSLPV